MLDDGSLVVAWIERGGTTGSVRLRRIGPGGTPGPSFEVARTGAARANGVPRLARDRDRLVVAWTDGKPARVQVAAVPHALLK
jgi:hypothetical protein